MAKAKTPTGKGVDTIDPLVGTADPDALTTNEATDPDALTTNEGIATRNLAATLGERTTLVAKGDPVPEGATLQPIGEEP